MSKLKNIQLVQLSKRLYKNKEQKCVTIMLINVCHQQTMCNNHAEQCHQQWPTIMLNNVCHQQTMCNNHAEQCLSPTNNVQQSCWTMSVTNKQCATIMLNKVCHQQTMCNNHAEQCLSPTMCNNHAAQCVTNNVQQPCWTMSATDKQCPTIMLNNVCHQ